MMKNKIRYFILYILFVITGTQASCQDPYRLLTLIQFGQLFESEYDSNLKLSDSALQKFYQDSSLKTYILVEECNQWNNYDHFVIYISDKYDSVDFACRLDNQHMLFIKTQSDHKAITTYRNPFPVSEYGLILINEVAYELVIDSTNQRYICVRKQNILTKNIKQFQNMEWNVEIVDAVVSNN